MRSGSKPCETHVLHFPIFIHPLVGSLAPDGRRRHPCTADDVSSSWISGVRTERLLALFASHDQPKAGSVTKA
jgi:hypothetical protein